MTRAGLILAATLLISPAWTSAQETEAALADTTFNDFIGEPISDGGFVRPAQEPSNQWAPMAKISNVTAAVDERLPGQADASWLDSNVQSQSPDVSDDIQQFGQGDANSDNSKARRDSGLCPKCATGNYCRHCCMGHNGQCRQADVLGGWVCDGCGCDVQGRPSFGPDRAFRFGWWGVDSKGSPVKVGEYQDLQSSPFWDLDGIWTDGSRTFDYTFSGLDPDANFARGYFYGPELTIKFDYERFLRQLDHEPLAAFDLDSGPPAADDKVVGQDLNVGEDYAIRVQQLEERIQGQLTNNLKWRVDLWGMRKTGERQTTAMAHCFNIDPNPGVQNNTCHVLSQKQNIDWTTVEVKPILEAHLGDAIVEYSRTMRGFGQNDQVVDRTYSRFNYSPANGVVGPPFVYAWVPENFTQIDRVKISQPVNVANQIYANLYLGNTENKFRDTNRGFSGYDLRWINRAVDGVTLTAFAKVDAQNGELPTTFLTTPPFGIGSGPADRYEPGSLRHPVEYNSGRFGLKGRWQSKSKTWLSVAGGYEFVELARDYADYDGTFTQEDTRNHLINVGPYMRVSHNLDTFVRYRGRIVNNPLLGYKASDGQFNTNQPEQDHGVEIGGTWSPTPYFMTTAQFGIQNSWNHSPDVYFDEDNYPILFTIWYAPTSRWSMTGGYAYFSNWIDQDITIGFRNNPTETTRWNYEGYNELVSFSSNYAWTACTQLVGGVEWNRGNNVFSVPPSTAGADWTLLPTFSDVIVQTTRVHVGVDHEFGKSMNWYFRYVYFDYNDVAMDYNSGTANMFLAGVTMLH